MSSGDFRAVFDENPLPMWLHDRTTQKFLLVNRAAVRFYGWSEEEFRNLTPRELRPDRRSGSFGLGEDVVVHRRKDGALAEMSLHAAPVSFDGTDAVLVVAQDISARRRIEEELHQAQKFEAIGRLAGGVAHDFNNILTAILGFSDLVLARLPAADPSRRPVEEIRKAGERAAQLTRQLLAFSRRQVLAPETLELNALVSGAEPNLRRVVGERVEVATELAEEIGSVMADPGQLEQILFHLALNARDAMPAGGRLTIRTRNAEISDEEARERFPMVPGRYVVLAVADTGEGMDDHVKSHLFEPFFTTKPKGAGTGLGLATVYGIVKQSGGFVWVTSQKGAGTSVEIYLPWVEKGPRRPATTAVHASYGGRRSILVVEDQPMVRTLVTTLLAEEGLSVLSAAEGEEALGLLADPARELDLLLTDVVMPGIDGTELARRARALRPGLRVLFMSGFADSGLVREGILDQGLTLLPKPFTRAELLRKVREALAAGADVTPRG